MTKLSVLAATALLALSGSALAEGDPVAGEKAFKKCSTCHAVGVDAKNKVGPELNGIVGRKVASVEGFKYSPAMIEFGAGDKVWDAGMIDAYLADPKGYIPKNRMAFAGLKKADERADVIAYLNQFNADGSAK